MIKRFNITGNCDAKKHYMADVSKKLEQVYAMVEFGDYFIINRPRQYGKTTTLFTIADKYINSTEYAVICISFEGVGDAAFATERDFCTMFIRILARHARFYLPEVQQWLKDIAPSMENMEHLSDIITDLANKTPRKIILIIDEVDKSSNNQLFVSFLAMLRDKYLIQNSFKTFHSIVLAGVHDVKTLKLKLRPEDEKKYNSPWNIAAEFKVDMNLQVAEIVPMLKEYAADKGVKMNVQEIAECLFYYTSGYPFFVSKLCKMLDEDMETNGEWTNEDIENAVKIVVNEKNTNLETLTKNLQEYPKLYELVYKIAVDNEIVPFNSFNEVVTLGMIHGIFKTQNGAGLKIHNRIYADVIYSYMTFEVLVFSFPQSGQTRLIYKNDDGTLNMETVMLGFQTFMKKEYSKKDRDFLERNGRLVFLAFIKSILNGSGHDFKEPQISDEKRLDVVITYLHQKFVAELKVWYGQKAHEKGLLQLADYLEIQSLTEGYLLIFDHSEIKNWDSAWIEVQGKRIFQVWV